MLRRIAFGLVAAVIGYVLGGVGGAWLISTLSSNTHDRSLEAVMTGAVVTGPLTAIIGFIIGCIVARPRTTPVSPGGGDSPA